MEKNMLHGYQATSREEISESAINELNHIAAHDLAKRTIPGSFFILIVLSLCAYSTTIFNDAALLSYLIFTIMVSSVISRFLLLRALPKQDNKLST